MIETGLIAFTTLFATVGPLDIAVLFAALTAGDTAAKRRAIALKAIAKTLSMTMKIANVAKEHGVPCFCADLTVNPILVDWNKAIEARLDPFPGLGLGLLETNGHQNYKNWDTMFSYHPNNGASWTQTKQGVFELNDDYYEKSGGILTESEHYMNMFNRKK